MSGKKPHNNIWVYNEFPYCNEIKSVSDKIDRIYMQLLRRCKKSPDYDIETKELKIIGEPAFLAIYKYQTSFYERTMTKEEYNYFKNEPEKKILENLLKLEK